MLSSPPADAPRPTLRGSTVVVLLALAVGPGACGPADAPVDEVAPATSPAADAATPSSGTSPARSTDATLQQMLARLDQLSGEVEDGRDVKCWTSFKKFETFVAGCQLAHDTTHVKTEVVIGWLDQLWRAAAEASGGQVVGVDTWTDVVGSHVPTTPVPIMRTAVEFGDVSVELPDKDIINYLATVEPVRVLQTLTQRVIRHDPTRPALDEPALREAHRLAAVLSAVVLKEGSAAARRSQRQVMEAADLLAADARLTASSPLEPYDAERWPLAAAGEAASEVSAEDARQQMLAVVEQKLGSLEVFNERYTRERLKGTFDSDLSAHEAEWAGRPVDPEASELMRRELLPAMARQLHRRCADENRGLDPLTGPAMLESILARYPFATSFDGYVNLFPNTGGVTDVWVEEFQADSLRDAGWHWWALGRALQEPTEGEVLPSLDLYAMEELTEFLSVYGVALSMIAGNIAFSERSELVTREHVELAAAEVEEDGDAYEASEPETHAEEPTESTRVEGGELLALAALEAHYIDVPFSDVTAGSGIDFAHESSALVRDYRFDEANTPQMDYLRGLRETSEKYDGPPIPYFEIGIGGGGVAAGDIDADGLHDVYLVSGKQDRLYRNLGGLRFDDVTADAGLIDDGEGRGAYFVDHDGDGDQDLFVTQVHAPSRLFENDGSGAFTDATEGAGLSMALDQVSHSATWFDYDNDGALDLYVGNLGNWLTGVMPLMMANSRNGQPNRLYKGDGQGGYQDVTEATGAGDTGWAHAVSHFDGNNDGWQDLFLANDFGEDVVLGNVNGQGFTNVTPECLRRHFRHGMSVGISDVDRDGVDDVYVSNIAMFTFDSKYIMPRGETKLLFSRRTTLSTRMAESNVLLASNGGQYEEAVQKYFDRAVEGCGWAWDADFFDFDNDGEEDLYVANGREANLSYDSERNVLFKQLDGHFYDVSAASGADFPANSRGVVHVDLDNDGDLDLLVNNYEGPATLLRNELQRNNWFRLSLVGAGTNREAYGARVILRAKGSVQRRGVRGGSGFLSKEPAAVHFGLGDAERIEALEVVWPGGQRTQLTDLPVNGEYQLVQGENRLTRLR